MCADCALSVSCRRVGAASWLICCERPSNAVSFANATLLIRWASTVICTCTTPYLVVTDEPRKVRGAETVDTLGGVVFAPRGATGVDTDGSGGADVEMGARLDGWSE